MRTAFEGLDILLQSLHGGARMDDPRFIYDKGLRKAEQINEWMIVDAQSGRYFLSYGHDVERLCDLLNRMQDRILELETQLQFHMANPQQD